MRTSKVPLHLESISAGFPSPADDCIDQTLDLNELRTTHPAIVFFVQMQGESMIRADIRPNEFLVGDRFVQAIYGDVVIIAL